MTDNQIDVIILDAVQNDPAALVSGIHHLFNCKDVDVNENGAIWIADPQAGHWLGHVTRAKVARAIANGDI